MTGTLNALLVAVVVFVGGHFLLSGAPLRQALIRRLGEQGFRGFYSLVAGGALVWMLLAYRDAPYLELWPASPALAWIPVLVMPISLFLIVAGVTTRSPMAVGGEALATTGSGDLSPGILRITRHPFLWGTALWALSHMVVNGDAASLVLMGGILVLSLGGMHHIDQRREASLGSAWGPIVLTTSLLPFVALAQHRTTMDWKGIGWWRPAVALALYAAILQLHELVFGVSALPA
ncbi:MAG: NnrU family protein [Kiloniellales bacterium]